MKRNNSIDKVTIAIIVALLLVGCGIFYSIQKTSQLKNELKVSEAKLKEELANKQLEETKLKEEQMKKEKEKKNMTLIENIDKAKTNYEAQVIAKMTPVENELQPKLDTGITVEMSEATNILYTAWDAELTNIYKLLMSELSENEKIKLRNSERAWIKKREKEASLASKEVEGGTLEPIVYAQTELNMIKERTIELSRLYDNMHK